MIIGLFNIVQIINKKLAKLKLPRTMKITPNVDLLSHYHPKVSDFAGRPVPKASLKWYIKVQETSLTMQKNYYSVACVVVKLKGSSSGTIYPSAIAPGSTKTPFA